MNKSFFSLVVFLSLVLASCNNGGGQASQTTSKGESSVESTTATPTDSVNNDAGNVAPGGQASSTQQANPASANGQVPQVEKAPMGEKANVKAPELKAGNVPAPADKTTEKQKVPVRPETPTDKLLKQYNEAMVALIDASKTGGDAKEAADKQFNDIKAQLEELDKNGKLSDTQKELFNVTNNAYNMLNSKQ